MKNNIKKEIKKCIKKKNINIHNLNLDDVISIHNALEAKGLINYSITDRCDNGGDYYTTCEYWSEKLKKIIIYDNDFYVDMDGGTVELMAESISQLDQEIKKFENSLSIKKGEIK